MASQRNRKFLQSLLRKNKKKPPSVPLPNSTGSASQAKATAALPKSSGSVTVPLPRSSAPITLIPPSQPVKTKVTDVDRSLFDVGEDYSKDEGFLDKVQSGAEEVEEWASNIGAGAGLTASVAKKFLPQASTVYNNAGRVGNVTHKVAKPLTQALYVLDAGRGLFDEDYREEQYANMDRLLEDEDKLGIALQLAQRPTTAAAGMVNSLLDAKDRINQAEAEGKVLDAKIRYLKRDRIRNINKILQSRRDKISPNRKADNMTIGRPEDY